MYIRTPRAFAWLESTHDEPTQALDGSRPDLPSQSAPAGDNDRQDTTPTPSNASAAWAVAAASTAWARQPLPCRQGLCVALRQADDGIELGLRDAQGNLLWKPVRSILSEQQLQRWIAGGGFARPRA